MSTFTTVMRKNGPIILLIGGCVGVVGTAVSAVFGKEKYDTIVTEKIEEKKQELEEKGEEVTEEATELKVTDKIRAGARAYWLTVLIACVSITCLVASNKIAATNFATLSAAYAANKMDYKKYVEKASQKMGAKKADEVEEEIVREKMDKNVPKEATVIVTGTGDQLFYDVWNDRYFWSDMQTIRKGVNDANLELMNSHQLSANEFYEFIAPQLAHTQNGGIFGWDSGMDGLDKIEVGFYAKEITEGQYMGRAAMAIHFLSGAEPVCNLMFHC